MSIEFNDTQAAAFARSTGLPASMGKASAELKTKVPDCVKDDFDKLARSLGCGSSGELLRDMVMVRLYGHEQVASMTARRLRLAAGMGPESVAEGAGA